jgi:curved DNA-binding protein CbpA
METNMTESNLDYYKILGLTQSATFEEIKQKYHEMAIKFHPDKMKSSLAEIMMKQINEAYDVLSDPTKRSTYDKSTIHNDIKSEIGAQNKKSKKQFNDVLDKLAKYGKLFSKGMTMFSNVINKFSQEINKFSHSAPSHTSQNETRHTSKTRAKYNNPSRKSVKQVHVYHHYDDDDYDKDVQIPNKTYEQNRKFAENLFSNSDSNKTIEYDDYGYNVENIYDTDYDKLKTKRRKAKHTNTDDYGFNVDDVFDL